MKATRSAIRLMALLGAALFTSGSALAYPAQAVQDLNLRSGPGTNYRVVDVIPGGGRVDVRSCSGSWCRVRYRGLPGFASANYLDRARGQARVIIRDVAPRVYSRPTIVRRDRDGDGFADTVRTRRPNGSAVVRRDTDGDGRVDTVRIRRPNGRVIVRRDLDGDGDFDRIIRRDR